VSVIQNCERFKIPLFIVRSKADINIKFTGIMQDLGYDENDDDSLADDNVDDYQLEARARQMLIDSTRNNVEKNLEEARLAKHDVFIVSSSVMLLLVTAKGHKKTTLAIDEVRLMETILMTAHARP
jgi:hypothetical protein